MHMCTHVHTRAHTHPLFPDRLCLQKQMHTWQGRGKWGYVFKGLRKKVAGMKLPDTGKPLTISWAQASCFGIKSVLCLTSTSEYLPGHQMPLGTRQSWAQSLGLGVRQEGAELQSESLGSQPGTYGVPRPMRAPHFFPCFLTAFLRHQALRVSS